MSSTAPSPPLVAPSSPRSSWRMAPSAVDVVPVRLAGSTFQGNWAGPSRSGKSGRTAYVPLKQGVARGDTRGYDWIMRTITQREFRNNAACVVEGFARFHLVHDESHVVTELALGDGPHEPIVAPRGSMCYSLYR